MATGTSNLKNKVYNSRFAPGFSVSMLKKISALVRSCVWKSFEHLRTMHLWICYCDSVILWRYNKYILVHNLKLLACLLNVCIFKNSASDCNVEQTRVSLATSNFKIEVYNGRFAPKFSVLTLKEVSALVQNYVKKLGAKKNKIK